MSIEWNRVHGEMEKERKRKEEIAAQEALEREKSMRRGYPRW